jgi:ribosomal protein S18 acetylase RimI-like enzyme
VVGDVGEAARLRPLRVDDADALGDVHVRAWQAAYRGLLPDDYLNGLTAAQRDTVWAAALAHPPRRRGGARLGAERDGRLVGFIVVGAASDDPAARTGEVFTLNVDPDHWGAGVGRALLAAGVDHLRASGFADAILWVLPGNARARRFYEQAGWRHDGAQRRQTVLGVEVDETGYRLGLDRPIDRATIEATHAAIRPHVRVTPVLELSGADLGLAAFPLTLKLELLQHAGSFKTRGAFANLLLRAVPAAGVVAASGGNHGAAVAYAAMRLGVRARIYVPTVSSPAKIARIRGYGAELVVTGDRYADALAASEAYVRECGALPVHAYDQAETLLGQGTLGLELAGQAPALDTLLVAVGGGGLIAGIAAWYAGHIRIVGGRARGGADADASARGGTSGRCRSRRHRRRFARPASRRRQGVSGRASLRRTRGAGYRRCDPRRAGCVMENVEDRRRAGRSGRVRWPPVRPLPAAAERTRRHPGQRGQHDGGGFRALNRGRLAELPMTSQSTILRRIMWLRRMRTWRVGPVGWRRYRAVHVAMAEFAEIRHRRGSDGGLAFGRSRS